MITLPKPQKYQTTLTSIEKVSDTMYLERFTLVNPTEFTFLPGQTVMLYVAPGVNRSMSIASSPKEKTFILLAHDVSPMGPYSKWALTAKPGDSMSFMGPLGMFIVDKTSPRKKIFVATGSGIAPFYAMIGDLLEAGETKEVLLFWGLRHEGDIFWQKEFTDLASAYPNFHFVLTLSQPSASWQGLTGHVQEHVFSKEKDLIGCDFYLCGSRGMVDETKVRLQQAGVPQIQLKSELFH